MASLVGHSILPRVVPDIELLAILNTHVLAIRIHPSAARPHYLTRPGPEEGAYVRVGSTNRRAGPEMLAKMRRFARGKAFDEQPMPDLPVDAVDFHVALFAFEDIRTLSKYSWTRTRVTKSPLPVTRNRDRRVFRSDRRTS